MALAGTCILLGSAAGRYVVVAAELPRLLRPIEALEGAHGPILAQFALLLAGLRGYSPRPSGLASPSVVAVLCAIAVAVWVAPAVCQRCRARPYIGALLVTLGVAVASVRVGAALGACLLLIAMPYEVGLLQALRRLSARRPLHMGTEPNRAALVAGAMFWSALITALPALHPVLMLVLTLGVMVVMWLHRAPYQLPARAVGLLARVSAARLYTWLVARSLPEAAEDGPD
jgi:hypothetical protein